MGSKFGSAVKCFIKCPVDSARLMLTSSYEPRTVEAIKARCPEVDVESFGFYVGLFMGIIFIVLCVMAYLFFYALRVVILYREMLFP
ncbi:MAG: hypothetical protein WBC40_07855 [Halobacteriota archaeon]